MTPEAEIVERAARAMVGQVASFAEWGRISPESRALWIAGTTAAIRALAECEPTAVMLTALTSCNPTGDPIYRNPCKEWRAMLGALIKGATPDDRKAPWREDSKVQHAD